MKHFFKGYYFKHQNGKEAISFIVGVSKNHAFLQVITNHASYYFPYPLKDYMEDDDKIHLPGCEFSRQGISINIKHAGVTILGKVYYQDLTPLSYDIMGIFQYLPMQCRHTIVSLHHRLRGFITINGDVIDLTGGVGYLEGDSGSSFPQEYFWIQCNDFKQKCSIVAAVADIPVFKFHFKGCIAIVYDKGEEYRFATYLGVRILKCTSKRLVLKQGRYLLDIAIARKKGQKLLSPVKGDMSRPITEAMACKARFRFYKNKKLIFDRKSNYASHEYVR